MREYKFRGMDVSQNVWRFGSLRMMRDGCEISWFNDDGNYHSCFVKPETVGQFAGLNDKNNNEIFEGDIVKETNPDFNFEENTAAVEFYGGSFYLDNDSEEHWSDDSEFEIIGNVYENPELLEKIK